MTPTIGNAIEITTQMRIGTISPGRNATQNIAASVRAAASGTADVAVNVRQAAEGASETGETSSRMFASAQALSGESLHLKAEVDGVLDRVHAA